MKILVTGAGGYLADRLIEQLISEGNEIVALYRTKYRKDLEQNGRVTFVKGDILHKEGLYDAMQGCGSIYHVAALSKSWAKDPASFYRVNVGGTLNLLSVAEDLGIKRVIVTSSAGAIGPVSGDTAVTEEQYRHVNFFSDYESSKYIMNEMAQDYVRRGMEVVIVCPTRIFGPGNLESDGSAVSQILRSYLDGKWRFNPGGGREIGNYAFIDDVVNGHILAMQHGRAGEKYLIGSFNDSISGIFETVDEITGKRRVMIPVPFSLMGFYANFMGGFARVFNFNPVITPGWVRKIKHNWTTDLSKAKNELGFEPTPKREAIEKTIEWIRNNKARK